jgi:hypothetical protein
MLNAMPRHISVDFAVAAFVAGDSMAGDSMAAVAVFMGDIELQHPCDNKLSHT